MGDIERIQAKVRRLREADRRYTVFGAESHRYRLNLPLTEAAVCAFEARHRVVLPGGYRDFLLRVGNGGAGPYYGLFPLHHAVPSDAPGFLAGAFPHRHWWNGVDPPDWFALPHAQIATPTPESEAAYFADGPIQGTLRLAHEGCGYYRILVVSGPERGTVWSDERASDGGVIPMPYPFSPLRAEGSYLIPTEGEAPRLSFVRWYEDWLDESLRSVVG